MPKLNNVNDLTQVREAKRQSLEAHHASGTTIYIGAGTCGIAAGARETMQAIQDELARRKIKAQVLTVGCIGICIKEPLVDIQLPGQPRITYANVKPHMVPRLVEEHLIQGQPVREWAVGQMPGDW